MRLQPVSEMDVIGEESAQLFCCFHFSTKPQWPALCDVTEGIAIQATESLSVVFLLFLPV